MQSADIVHDELRLHRSFVLPGGPLLYRKGIPKFAGMKKVVLVALVLLLLASCNRAVCPAYSDSVNDMKNTIFQKGSHRADGINRVYRDSSQKKLR